MSVSQGPGGEKLRPDYEGIETFLPFFVGFYKRHCLREKLRPDYEGIETYKKLITTNIYIK